MTRKKRIAKLPCQLMSKEQAIALKLQEQPFLIIIPKSILQKLGIHGDEMMCDLVLEDNRLCLIIPVSESITQKMAI